MPMSLRRFVTVHLRGVMIVLLFLGSCSKANKTIEGFYGERLDISCPIIKDRLDKVTVLLIDSNTLITYKGGGERICNKQHKFYMMCMKQIMNCSSVYDNLVHFVINKVPAKMNGSNSSCHFPNSMKPHEEPKTIILKEKLEGYVNVTVKMECPICIPKGHNKSYIALQINMTPVQRWLQTENTFVCVKNTSFYQVCLNHMKSSYVNNSVYFVFDKIPAYLNESDLKCFARTFRVHINDRYDEWETILTLYEGVKPTATYGRTCNTSTSTAMTPSRTCPIGARTNTTESTNTKTASTTDPDHGVKPTATTTTTNTTASTNTTTASATPVRNDKKSSSHAWVAAPVILGIVFLVVLGVVVYKCRTTRNTEHPQTIQMR